MGDLFREINEELRQDRYEQLWQNYGKYAISIGMALVVSVIGWKAWNHYTVSQHQAQSRQIVAGRQKGRSRGTVCQSGRTLKRRVQGAVAFSPGRITGEFGRYSRRGHAL